MPKPAHVEGQKHPHEGQRDDKAKGGVTQDEADMVRHGRLLLLGMKSMPRPVPCKGARHQGRKIGARLPENQAEDSASQPI
ncbi:hypothetical protein MACH21_24940 [Roseicyclus marinus]|uniref:Uncharacterized protein n=1 Tax=Roseicyclus marinus TaxID=2161673 RepID=A0AA48H9L1_9RHOB|nr:hypothetical protein MACH21_24940 [Roseicyclus marinus]